MIQDKKCLFICGMHRSNTSYITKVLQQAGLFIGDDLIPANDFNKEGHFEEQHIVSFHQQLIKAYQLESWQSIIDYTKLKTTQIKANHYQQAEELIQQYFPNSQFGFKDPRTCFFLPFWNTILPDAKFLFIIRHPTQCVQSLLRRSTANRWIKWRPDLIWRYFNFWDVSNQLILDFAQQHPEKSIVVFTPEDVLSAESNKVISKRLKEDWHFDLGELHFKDSYDSDLATSDIVNNTISKLYSKRKASAVLYQKLLGCRV